MTGKTHIVGGIALATYTSLYAGVYEPKEFTIVSIGSFSLYLMSSSFGAIIADVDTSKSTISSRYKILSFLIRVFLLLTHRNFTHSILGLCLFSTLFSCIGRILPEYIFIPLLLGFIIGYFSHLLLDDTNPRGIYVFYPIKSSHKGLLQSIFLLMLMIYLFKENNYEYKSLTIILLLSFVLYFMGGVITFLVVNIFKNQIYALLGIITFSMLTIYISNIFPRFIGISILLGVVSSYITYIFNSVIPYKCRSFLSLFKIKTEGAMECVVFVFLLFYILKSNYMIIANLL